MDGMTKDDLRKDPRVQEIVGEAVQTTVQGFMHFQQQIVRDGYRQRNRLVRKGQIVFAGSSLMENFPLAEFELNEVETTTARGRLVYNRGIGGYVAKDLLEALEDCVLALEPSTVFLNIGTNDIAFPGYRLDALLATYEEILLRVRERLPAVRVVLLAYYPVNAAADYPGIDAARKAEMFRTRTNPTLREANEAVRAMAARLGCEFADVNDGLFDAAGDLRAEYAAEGVHLLPEAYAIVWENLKKQL